MRHTAGATQQERIRELRREGNELAFLARLLERPPSQETLRLGRKARLLGDGTLEEVQLEFTRLFSAPPVPVPPYQSFYTDVWTLEPGAPMPGGCGAAFPRGEFHGYLGGPSTSELKRWYREAGFQTPEGELPDHVSVELSFIAHLLYAEASALERGDSEDAGAWRALREEFIHQFPARWFKQFSDRVLNARAEAYAPTALRLCELTRIHSGLIETSRDAESGLCL